MRKLISISFSRHQPTLLSAALILMIGGSAWGQQTITYNDGDDDSTNYSTSIPNDPTTLTINSGAATQSGVLSGSGSVIKTGAGALTLSRSNTYLGGTTLNAGTLVIGNNNVFGTGDLTIMAGTMLEGDGARRITNNMLATGDFSVAPRNTLPTISALELDGNLALGDTTRTIANTLDFFSFEFGQVNFGGVISGDPGVGLNLRDNGSLPGFNTVFFRFDGTGANTYDGPTTVGTNVSLALDKTANVTALAGDVTVEQEAVLVTLANEQIADTSTVTLEGNGRLQVGNGVDVTETIATLNDDGNGLAEVALNDDSTGSTLQVGSGTFSGAITGGVAGGTSLVKQGSGTLTLTGTNTYLGGTTITAGELHIGNGGTTGSIPGDVTNDGFLIFNRSDDITYADAITGTGGLGKLGAGRLELTGSNSGDLGTFIDAGTLVVSGSITHLGGSVVVANGAGTDATLEISATGSISSGLGIVGFGDGSTGLATVTAGSWTNTDSLTVGAFGNGTLEISGTGMVSSGGGIMGLDEDAVGTANVSGGSWVNTSVLAVGDGGTGNLNISGTGIVSNTIGVMGSQDTASGTANVSGGSWVNSIGLSIGDEGSGTVNLTGGSLVAPNIELAQEAGSSGILNIGTGTTAGILDASIVEGGDGDAQLNFNHSEGNYYFTDNGTDTGNAITISGTTAVEHLGSGVTTLNGANTYTGGTLLSTGTLVVGNNSALGTGDLVIEDGTTLATPDAFFPFTSYALDNDVFVQGDFNVSPNGQLTLLSSFDLNGNVDLTGDTRTITNLTENGPMHFGGVISNGGLTLDVDFLNVSGYFQFKGSQANTYTGDTTVGELATLSLNKDDNVTAIAGDVSIEDLGYLITLGNEQIADDSNVHFEEFADMRIGLLSNVTETIGSLSDDGSGNGLITLNGSINGSTLRVNTGDFSGDITGGGASSISLEKYGSGKLILSGFNDYIGDTFISGGVLEVSEDENLGTTGGLILGPSRILFDGGVLRTTASFETERDTVLDGVGGRITTANNSLLIHDGVISGTGRFQKGGNGELRLTGTNTYTGRTEVLNGLLSIYDGGSIDTTSNIVIAPDEFDDAEFLVNGSGAGGSATTTGGLVVGRRGIGEVTIEEGGTVEANGVIIGRRFSGLGILTVDGAGSTLTATPGGSFAGEIIVGNRGSGGLDIDNGGTVNAETLTVGNFFNGEGGFRVREVGSLLNVTGDLILGDEGFGDGIIARGGRAEIGGSAVLGSGFDGLAEMIMRNSGSTFDVADTLTVADEGEADLIVRNGAAVTAGTAVIGAGVDGEGILGLIGSGTNLQVDSDIKVAGLGIGGLFLYNGATGSASDLSVGEGLDSLGILEVAGSGSRLDLSGDFNFGVAGSAEGLIEDGGVVSVDLGGIIGLAPDSMSELEVIGSGSVLNFGEGLDLGESGVGRLRVDQGATARASDLDIGGSVNGEGILVVRGAGSEFVAADSETLVGVEGRGILMVRDGGVFRQSGTSTPLAAGLDPTGNGLVVIGARFNNPAAPGILDVSGIVGGDGRSRLRLNHDGMIALTRDNTASGTPIILSGGLEVQHRSGFTTIMADNSYTGGAELSGGTVQVNTPAGLGTGPLDFSDGAFVPMTRVGIDGDFDWSGGTFVSLLGASATGLDTNGALNLTGTGEFSLLAEPGFRNKEEYLLIDAGSPIAATPADFFGNDLFSLTPEFRVRDDQLFVIYPGSLIVSGPVLQNSSPVSTPIFADFVVNGQARTGSPTENNEIRSLTFNSGSSLQVFNQLLVSDGIFAVPTGTGTISGGQLVTPGDFSKTGGGNLSINSLVNVGGKTQIDGGGLIILGTLNTGDVNMNGERFEIIGTVNAQGVVNLNGGSTIVNGLLSSNDFINLNSGRLEGTGVIRGNFNNFGGTVAPGNSIGTLTVDGNFMQTSDGTLESEIQSPGNADLLYVTGTANIAGTLLVQAISGQLSFGDVVTVLVAEGGINGLFDRVTGAPSGFRARQWKRNGNTQLNLIFAPASYTQVATTPNQVALASALDQWIGVSDRRISLATLQLDLLREAAYPIVFESILPTLYGSLAPTAFSNSRGDGRTVTNQANFARSRIPAPASEPKEAGESGEAAADSESASTEKPVDSISWRVWADARGGYDTYDPLNLDTEGGTILTGADFIATQSAVLGLYIGGQRNESDNSGPDFTATGPRFGLYGSVGLFENAYLSAVIGGGTQDIDTDRDLAFGGSADADFDAFDWFTRLEGGYTFHAAEFLLTPFVGLQYSRVEYDGFTEDSDSVFALAVEDWSADRVEGFLGADISRPIIMEKGHVLTPYARLALRDTLTQNESTLDARLDSGNGPGFTFDATDPDSDGFEYGLGIRLGQPEQGWSLNLGYFGFSGDNGNTNQVNLGFSMGL